MNVRDDVNPGDHITSKRFDSSKPIIKNWTQDKLKKAEEDAEKAERELEKLKEEQEREPVRNNYF